jgi:hypothetical protein
MYVGHETHLKWLFKKIHQDEITLSYIIKRALARAPLLVVAKPLQAEPQKTRRNHLKRAKHSSTNSQYIQNTSKKSSHIVNPKNS